MSTHKLLAVGAAGAIGYIFYRWSSIPDTSQGIYYLSFLKCKPSNSLKRWI